MTQRTKVYIVTPCLNAEDTIAKTINSVLSQAGDFDLYYHVQDAGSKDRTMEIVRQFAKLIDDKTLPILCNNVEMSFASEADNGLYDGICKAFARFRIAPDDWMSWINADDILLPGSAALVTLIDQTPSQRHIKWITGGTAILVNDTVTAVEIRPVSSPVVAAGLCDGKHWHFIQQEGTFFRNITWKKVDAERTFRKFRYAGDWNLWRLMAQHYRLYQVDRPLGLFRIRPNQISQVHAAEYDAETRVIVPDADRLIALRRLAEQKLERYYLTFSYPAGVPGFLTESIKDNAAFRVRTVLGPTYDAQWQFPAVTEKIAFERAWQSLPKSDDFSYFAFPWATLIDLLQNGSPDAEPLMAALKKLGAMKRAPTVVTVCQHVRMLHYRKLFEQAGVTDIFWSHAATAVPMWPGSKKINLHPFPLYPVQVTEMVPFDENEQREHLFSFAGAKSNTWYLSDVREHIVDELGDDPRGVVIGRDEWHYNRIVYDLQIRKAADSAGSLVNDDASQEFKKLLRNSTFSLCPSGSGPNSIRLWESMGMGTIPVILSDSHRLPGDPELWKEATVVITETVDAVRALPDLLASFDQEAIAKKRRALRQLWLLYSPANFIHDLRKFVFAVPSGAAPKEAAASGDKHRRTAINLFGKHSNRTPLAYAEYRRLFEGKVRYTRSVADADILITGFDKDIGDNFEVLVAAKAANPKLRICVISEEPLWDVVWSKESRKRIGKIERGGQSVSYEVHNYTNSDVMATSRIPYFLTTSDEYFARYNYLLSRYVHLSPEQMVARWKAAPNKAAFMAEKRTDARYDTRQDDIDVVGLSVFRTRVAEALEGPGVVCQGSGWATKERRQDRADWHLDKLVTLSDNCCLISAIENTHHPRYASEKIFDAFACGAIPIYYARKGHVIETLCPEAYLNVADLTIDAAVEAIKRFEPTVEFAAKWLKGVERLLALVSDPRLLHAERRRVVAEVVKALGGPAATDQKPAAANGEKPAAAKEASAPKTPAAKAEPVADKPDPVIGKPVNKPVAANAAAAGANGHAAPPIALHAEVKKNGRVALKPEKAILEHEEIEDGYLVNVTQAERSEFFGMQLGEGLTLRRDQAVNVRFAIESIGEHHFPKGYLVIRRFDGKGVFIEQVTRKIELAGGKKNVSFEYKNTTNPCSVQVALILPEPKSGAGTLKMKLINTGISIVEAA